MLSVLILPFILWAQPDFTNKVAVENIRCFWDVKIPNLAYYAPGKLSIVTDREGKPDFNFLRTGYVGTAVYADQYTSRLNSIVRFRVKMNRHSSEMLAKVKAQLWPAGGNVRLLPLPITNIKTNLNFTTIGDNTESTNFRGGQLSAENKDGLNNEEIFWREREFTLRLDEKSADVLWASLDSGQCLMSLSYAFFSEGKTGINDEVVSDGGKEILDKLKEQNAESGDSIKTKQICVLADAFSIHIDTKKWPGLMHQVDINQEIPPAYAALAIYCYDFNNQLRPDLFAKRIEIKAKGVGRGDVLVKAIFSSKDPDIYVYNIKFPYAVKLDQPLYYRVTSIGNETVPVKTVWIEREQWAGIIDITSSEDEIIEPNESEGY